MRFILFLLITFIFAACGHQKIRFSKVNRKQKVVEVNEIPSLKKQSETAFVEKPEQEISQIENISTAPETRESDESVQENINSSSDEIAPYFPKTDEDSTTISEEDIDYITQEAVRAEKLGNWSLASAIASPVLFLLALALSFLIFGGIGIVGVIVVAVMAISSLVFLVMSYVLGIASLRAQYNTPRGRKNAISGIVVASIFLALLLFINFIGF